MTARNEVQGFVLEHHGIRGSLVRLNETWANIIALHGYPARVRNILGQGVAATVLLATGLKGKPKVSMQLQGQGPVSLLVIQCSRELRVRGMVQWRDAAADEPMLSDGRLSVMLDTADERGIFQGIVPLVSSEIDACLEAYFRQSEQLPTHLISAADERSVAGLMLQALPGYEHDSERLERAAAEARQIEVGALHSEAAEALLPAIFPEETIRLFASRPVLHDCRCTPEHLAGIARMLGADELNSILAERGNVELTCEFCNRAFSYDADDVATIVTGGTPQATMH
jgi:molecular chaperone Hsp33